MKIKDVKISKEFYDIAISNYSLNNLNLAFNLFKEMTQRQINPDGNTLTKLSHSIFQSVDTHKAKSMITTCSTSNIILDEYSINNFLNLFKKTGMLKSCKKLLETYKKSSKIQFSEKNEKLLHS